MLTPSADINIDPYLNADGIGHLTTEIYWSMIEMGISVVAACLPTLAPLVGDKSPLEGVIRSVRSILSLGSSHSLQRSQETAPGNGMYSNKTSTRANDSIAHSMNKAWTHVSGNGSQNRAEEIIPMKDLKARH